MKDNNKKFHIIILVFALVFLFLVIFFIWPLLKEIEKNSEDLILAKNNMVSFGNQIDEAEDFKNNYEAYKPNLEKIDQLFVDPNNPVDFIKFLEDTASSFQITSKISLPLSSQNPQQFIIFQFSSVGSFSKVLDFSKKIETGPYLIEIENLTIQNSGNNTDKSVSKDYSSRKVDAVFTIKVFIKPS